MKKKLFLLIACIAVNIIYASEDFSLKRTHSSSSSTTQNDTLDNDAILPSEKKVTIENTESSTQDSCVVCLEQLADDEHDTSNKKNDSIINTIHLFLIVLLAHLRLNHLKHIPI